MLASSGRVNAYPLTWLNAFHIVADFNHSSAHLVAHDERESGSGICIWVVFRW